MVGYQIQIINNDMFLIKRKIRIDSNPIIETWKEHLRCDKVFKNTKEGVYYFCELIPEAEVIEYTDN